MLFGVTVSALASLNARRTLCPLDTLHQRQWRVSMNFQQYSLRLIYGYVFLIIYVLFHETLSLVLEYLSHWLWSCIVAFWPFRIGSNTHTHPIRCIGCIRINNYTSTSLTWTLISSYINDSNVSNVSILSHITKYHAQYFIGQLNWFNLLCGFVLIFKPIFFQELFSMKWKSSATPNKRLKLSFNQFELMSKFKLDKS